MQQRITWILAGAVVIAALAPASALGSTASKAGNQITVAAGGGEDNRINVSFSAVTYTITDTAGVTAGAMCAQVTPNTVTCPDGAVNKIVVNAGSKDDSVTLDQATIPTSVSGTLNGERGKDVLLGANGHDILTGEQQNDTLDGRGGADRYTGGNGDDTVTYAAHAGGVIVTIGSGTGDDGNSEDQTGGAKDTVGADIESLLGTNQADLIIGDGSDETLFALAGTDVVRGAAGGDKVVGGPDNDTVVGGADDDKVVGKAGVDILKGKRGIDRLKARDGTSDSTINCGKGPKRLEFAKFDRGLDPRPQSC